MTTIVYRHSPRQSSLARQFRRLRNGILQAWKRHQDERMLESLPFETLKDIGFPVSGAVKSGNTTL